METLNKKQERLLIEIGKQDGKRSMHEIGRRVYDTAVSVYNNMTFMKDMGLIDLHRKKNKVIPFLTEYGRSWIDDIFQKK